MPKTIDILIDVNGYTKDARTKVFALRPAPIAVNWFGFPGTMGSPYHHYIIADPYIILEGSEHYYSEKVLRLPCYQPSDRKRPVAAERPVRADEGLPEDAFVYCCLNGMQKITPGIFQAWMRILAEVPNSVLWLLGGPEPTNARLRLLAKQQGIGENRLVLRQEANPQQLSAGGRISRHLSLRRPYDGRRCHVDGRAVVDRARAGLCFARMRKLRTCRGNE